MIILDLHCSPFQARRSRRSSSRSRKRSRSNSRSRKRSRSPSRLESHRSRKYHGRHSPSRRNCNSPSSGKHRCPSPRTGQSPSPEDHRSTKEKFRESDPKPATGPGYSNRPRGPYSKRSRDECKDEVKRGIVTKEQLRNVTPDTSRPSVYEPRLPRGRADAASKQRSSGDQYSVGRQERRVPVQEERALMEKHLLESQSMGPCESEKGVLKKDRVGQTGREQQSRPTEKSSFQRGRGVVDSSNRTLLSQEGRHDQHRGFLDQGRGSVYQDCRSIEQERRPVDQDRAPMKERERLTEQVRKPADQDHRSMDQDRRFISQSRGPVDQDGRSLHEDKRTVGEGRTGTDPCRFVDHDRRSMNLDQIGFDQDRRCLDQARSPTKQVQRPTGEEQRRMASRPGLVDQDMRCMDQIHRPRDRDQRTFDQYQKPCDQDIRPAVQGRRPQDKDLRCMDQARGPLDQSRMLVDPGRGRMGQEDRGPPDQSRDPIDQSRQSVDQGRRLTSQKNRGLVHESTQDIDEGRSPSHEGRRPMDYDRGVVDQGRGPVTRHNGGTVAHSRRPVDQQSSRPLAPVRGPMDDSRGQAEGKGPQSQGQCTGTVDITSYADHGRDPIGHTQENKGFIYQGKGHMNAGKGPVGQGRGPEYQTRGPEDRGFVDQSRDLIHQNRRQTDQDGQPVSQQDRAHLEEQKQETRSSIPETREFKDKDERKIQVTTYDRSLDSTHDIKGFSYKRVKQRRGDVDVRSSEREGLLPAAPGPRLLSDKVELAYSSGPSGSHSGGKTGVDMQPKKSGRGRTEITIQSSRNERKVSVRSAPTTEFPLSVREEVPSKINVVPRQVVMRMPVKGLPPSTTPRSQAKDKISEEPERTEVKQSAALPKIMVTVQQGKRPGKTDSVERKADSSRTGSQERTVTVKGGSEDKGFNEEQSSFKKRSTSKSREDLSSSKQKPTAGKTQKHERGSSRYSEERKHKDGRQPDEGRRNSDKSFHASKDYDYRRREVRSYEASSDVDDRFARDEDERVRPSGWQDLGYEESTKGGPHCRDPWRGTGAYRGRGYSTYRDDRWNERKDGSRDSSEESRTEEDTDERYYSDRADSQGTSQPEAVVRINVMAFLRHCCQ